ncbi:MAG: hypothetical protein KAH38_03170, partial [Candidatus Hydrogenedentes bacterium]|nr:hypothetical protein [Candidatus Hydrogenedentota bacterium]
ATTERLIITDCIPLEGEPMEGEPDLPCPLPPIYAIDLAHILWLHLDRNTDGVLTFEEIIARYPQFRLEWFQRADQNPDGMLDLDETVNMIEEGNSNGEPPHPGDDDIDIPVDLVSRIDRNGDRLIQYREVALFLTLRQFQWLDYNNNRVLDCEDWERIITLPPPPGEGEMDPHWLPVENDPDGDFLTTEEEELLGMRPDIPDQNRNQIPDGVDLARRLSSKIESLVWIHADGHPPHMLPSGDFEELLPTNQSYVIHFDYMLDCVYECAICGDYTALGHLQIVNPAIHNSWTEGFVIPLHAWHFMLHGSFSYLDGMCGPDYERARIDIAQLHHVLLAANDPIEGEGPPPPPDGDPTLEGEVPPPPDPDPMVEGENIPSDGNPPIEGEDGQDYGDPALEGENVSSNEDPTVEGESVPSNEELTQEGEALDNRALDIPSGCNGTGSTVKRVGRFLLDYFLLGLAAMVLLGITYTQKQPE